MKLRPFNLVEALAGKKVVDIDGEEYTNFCRESSFKAMEISFQYKSRSGNCYCAAPLYLLNYMLFMVDDDDKTSWEVIANHNQNVIESWVKNDKSEDELMEWADEDRTTKEETTEKTRDIMDITRDFCK